MSTVRVCVATQTGTMMGGFRFTRINVPSKDRARERLTPAQRL